MSSPLLVQVRVTPDAKTNSLIERLSDHYDISVKVPAQGGQANKQACELIAWHFSVPVHQVVIVRGGRSPKKIIAVYGL